MNSKEMVFKAMEMGKPPRVPVAPFGCGVWTIHRSGTTFKELSRDAERMARTNLDIYHKFKPDIVYVGSGYNNLHAAALGARSSSARSARRTWKSRMFIQSRI